MRFPFGQASGFGELPQLAAIDDGLEDVLLDREIAIGHVGHGGAELRDRLDGVRESEVGDIVGGGFRAQEQMVAHVLLDRRDCSIAPQ